jgi:hypothetical protein
MTKQDSRGQALLCTPSMVNRIILMILIVKVFTHKCFDDNYHKIVYTVSKKTDSQQVKFCL